MPGLESLPGRFPIFPLPGAVLLPGGNLPLNIFEPRYLQMVRDAMQTDKVIGMIQPRGQAGGGEAAEGQPPIYGTGCAGRISSFRETEDGRFLITLTGIARFDVAEELAVTTPYRQVVAAFDRWHDDLQPEPPPDALRGDLLTALKGYFERQQIEADWETIKDAPLAGLVTSLVMICPFEPNEKQALLEAANLNAQAELLIALMCMAGTTGAAEPSVLH
ncbi:MAG: LON peptidase substrate-binding domain-containing protein [Geminicoccaceae bacterium]|jgi:Lon protease-like protein|nr:LON peptidase substrate-binding domain-containing protein [Geminicoccaceae bacterium]HRY23210.1 LON peptidase substrate-binding domain-containing protein [Geminicoccaceae bacterium]